WITPIGRTRFVKNRRSERRLFTSSAHSNGGAVRVRGLTRRFLDPGGKGADALMVVFDLGDGRRGSGDELAQARFDLGEVGEHFAGALAHLARHDGVNVDA